MTTLENIDTTVDKLNENYFQVNSSLAHLKDLPDRLRKLEDKSIIYDLLKVGVGIVMYVLIANYAEEIKYVREPKTELAK